MHTYIHTTVYMYSPVADSGIALSPPCKSLQAVHSLPPATIQLSEADYYTQCCATADLTHTVPPTHTVHCGTSGGSSYGTPFESVNVYWAQWSALRICHSRISISPHTTGAYTSKALEGCDSPGHLSSLSLVSKSSVRAWCGPSEVLASEWTH